MIDQNPTFNIDYSKSQLVIMHEILIDVMHIENEAEEGERMYDDTQLKIIQEINKKVEHHLHVEAKKSDAFLFDNEKRNPEIVKRMSKVIDKGYEVVIWPDHLVEKDLNDMTISGHNVQSLVEFNTYDGLEANVKLSEWKKV